jgi:hypothetical protein
MGYLPSTIHCGVPAILCDHAPSLCRYYIKVPQASGPKIKVAHVAEEAEPGLAVRMQVA